MGNKNEWNIGVCIAKLRESRGLSQKQLSDELGKLGLKVRRETVTQWENGTRDLKTEYTIKLADFFGVSCDYTFVECPPKTCVFLRKLGCKMKQLTNYVTSVVGATLLPLHTKMK